MVPLMLKQWFQRLILCAGVLLLSSMLFTAARPNTSDTPQDPSLAGQLLVATPEMGDPHFSHAVILMVRHDKTGALGIVINRPVEQVPVARLLDILGQDNAGVTGDVQVFAGGPVEPRAGFVIHSDEYQGKGTLDIDGHVAMTTDPQIYQDIGHHKGPKHYLVAFGYAGWGPGQLEREMQLGGWFTVPEQPSFVFDMDRDKLWDEMSKRRTYPL